MQGKVRVWLRFAASIGFLVPIASVLLFFPSLASAESFAGVSDNKDLTLKTTFAAKDTKKDKIEKPRLKASSDTTLSEELGRAREQVDKLSQENSFLRGALADSFSRVQALQQELNLNRPGASSSDWGWDALSRSLIVTDAALRNILPKWVNLDFGFNLTLNNSPTTGSYFFDYLLPAQKSARECFFLEAHGEYLGYWRNKSEALNQSTLPFFAVPVELITTSAIDSSPNRHDFSFGAGYRKLFGDSTLIGVNSFCDSSNVFNEWHSSWGWG